MKKLLTLTSSVLLIGLLASCSQPTPEQIKKLDKAVDRAFTKQLIETAGKEKILDNIINGDSTSS